MKNFREQFLNWAKHLDSDGYFGALETFDTFIAPMLESLHDIEGEWCKHPAIRLDSNADLRRDWCCDCHNWIYRNELTTAREAINAFEEKLK